MVDDDKTPPKGTEPQGVDQATKDYLANAISEQLKLHMPVMIQAFEQQLNKFWSTRFEALEDRLSGEGKNASPHISNSKLRQEHFETTGPSFIPPRRNGKDPLFPQDSSDPLDSFVGDGRQPPKGPRRQQQQQPLRQPLQQPWHHQQEPRQPP